MLVAVICNQLSIISYIFRHCNLLVLNKSHEKKLQVKDNSFTDCHTEGLIVKANQLWPFLIKKKCTQVAFVIEIISFVKTDSIIKKRANFFLLNLTGSVLYGSETWCAIHHTLCSLSHLYYLISYSLCFICFSWNIYTRFYHWLIELICQVCNASLTVLLLLLVLGFFFN